MTMQTTRSSDLRLGGTAGGAGFAMDVIQEHLHVAGNEQCQLLDLRIQDKCLAGMQNQTRQLQLCGSPPLPFLPLPFLSSPPLPSLSLPPIGGSREGGERIDSRRNLLRESED